MKPDAGLVALHETETETTYFKMFFAVEHRSIGQHFHDAVPRSPVFPEGVFSNGQSTGWHVNDGICWKLPGSADAHAIVDGLDPLIVDAGHRDQHVP